MTVCLFFEENSTTFLSAGKNEDKKQRQEQDQNSSGSEDGVELDASFELVFDHFVSLQSEFSAILWLTFCPIISQLLHPKRSSLRQGMMMMMIVKNVRNLFLSN